MAAGCGTVSLLGVVPSTLDLNKAPATQMAGALFCN
jgi:hypothetical protein